MAELDQQNSSAPRIEGLSERSITEYGSGDLAKKGVRGVRGAPAVNARVRAFGSILVIEAWGPGSEIERRPLRPGLPTIDIIFVEHGQFEYLDGSAWRSSSGPLLIAPSGLPHRARFTGDWRFMVARVPRETILSFAPMLQDTVGIYEDLTIPEQAMRAFLAQSVADTREVSEAESRIVDRQVREMAGTLVLGRQGAAVVHGAPRTVLWHRALAVIAERSGEQQLSPEILAAEVNSSLRRLQEVFAEADSSVAAEIRRERARVARALLQDSRFDELDTGTIAERAGFGSGSSMRRALEHLYGLTPRELRTHRAAG